MGYRIGNKFRKKQKKLVFPLHFLVLAGKIAKLERREAEGDNPPATVLFPFWGWSLKDVALS
jgi:hypothetical protein